MKPGLAALLPLALGVMLIDGYDLQVMALLVPVLAQEWAVAPSDFGWVLSAPLLGLGAGAALLGPLGDRFGRRPAILSGIALLTASVALSAMAPDMLVMGISRFLTGLFLGVALPNVTALVAEIAPEKSRSAAMTFVAVGIAVGAILAGLLVPPILERFGWRGAYMLSVVVGSLVWLALWLRLPESPAFVARGGRAEIRAGNQYLRLFEGALSRRTPLFWLLYVAAAFTLYLLTSWLPVLLTGEGWTVAEASRAIAMFQTGGLFGGLGIAVLMDRWRPDYTLLLALFAAAMAIGGLAMVPSERWMWIALIAALGAAMSGVIMVLPALTPHLYPPDLLSTGLGVTVAVGRIGAIGGPLAGAALIAAGLHAGQVLLVLLPALAICAATTIALRLKRPSEILAPAPAE